MGGGHGEHHHHEPCSIPDYKIYSDYRKHPELVRHEHRLAQMGLKDPWIRNYTWMFDTRNVSGFPVLKQTIGAGFWVGLGYATVLITSYHLYQRFKRSRKAKKGGGEHHDSHH